MATLEINGRDVEVDDSFLSLTPEQQNATVEEIAASLGSAQPKALQGTPGKMAAPAGVSDNVQFAPGQAPPTSYRPDLMTSTAATVNGIVNSVPFLQGASDQIMARTGQLFGGDYDQIMGDLAKKRDMIAQASPVSRVAGEVAGSIGGFGLLGKSAAGAEALGLTGNLGKQAANSALSSAAYSGLMGLSEGEGGSDLLGNIATGGALGVAAPFLGAGIKAAGRGINNAVIRPIATMANRENEAIARVGRAIEQDRNVGGLMTQADEAVANRAGAEVTNADRFGSATRGLARTAANVSPEAQGSLRGLVDDRFHTQGKRAKSFVTMLMGGATDDLALQDSLRTAAQAANNTAYDAARANPASRAIWNAPIKELMQSPTFRSAVNAAETVGADRAAVGGFKPVRNPFAFDEAGNARLAMKSDAARAAFAKAEEAYATNPTLQNAQKLSDAQINLNKVLEEGDGPVGLPSLDFWDQVKRNLDRMIEDVKPTPVGGGNRTAFADLTAIKRKLVSALDEAIPEYKSARQGAAAFFGADDAVDAGRKAFSMTKEVPELRRAHFRMTPAEKEAASVGYASSLIDAIDASRDRVNVINNLFGSESARLRNELFLGPQRARELEAYVKVEQTLDLLRNAVSGNSTTAQQLISAGVIGGAGAIGFFGSGGDMSSAGGLAFLAAMGRRGLQMAGKKVDDQVMNKVAEMLASGDPKMVERAIQNASISKEHMAALDAIMRGFDVSLRAAPLAIAN